MDRARLMSRIRQAGTMPELALRKVARAAGLKVLENGRALPGSPDLFSIDPPRAVFVHGCFWHRHAGCRAATTPKAHRAFWVNKFLVNCRRDRRNARDLRRLGYRVMTVWECQVGRSANVDRVAGRLVRFFAPTSK
jgi:DNA mismatch endonuclease, patch repair protein